MVEIGSCRSMQFGKWSCLPIWRYDSWLFIRLKQVGKYVWNVSSCFKNVIMLMKFWDTAWFWLYQLHFFSLFRFNGDVDWLIFVDRFHFSAHFIRWAYCWTGLFSVIMRWLFSYISRTTKLSFCLSSQIINAFAQWSARTKSFIDILKWL